MANLLWKNKKETNNLLSRPFSSEEEFEKLIFETQEILEDIFLLKRQIRGGNKSGIPENLKKYFLQQKFIDKKY